MFDIFVTLMKDFGIPIGLVGFFIYRDYMREKSMTERINILEKEIQDILKELATKTTSALLDNSSLVKMFIKKFDERPCIAGEIAKELVENKT